HILWFAPRHQVNLFFRWRAALVRGPRSTSRAPPRQMCAGGFSWGERSTLSRIPSGTLEPRAPGWLECGKPPWSGVMTGRRCGTPAGGGSPSGDQGDRGQMASALRASNSATLRGQGRRLVVGRVLPFASCDSRHWLMVGFASPETRKTSIDPDLRIV